MSTVPSDMLDRGDGPRRGVVFALVAVIIVLLGTGAALLQMYRRAAGPQEPWQARNRAERLRAARAFEAIAEIQDSPNALAAAAPGHPPAARADDRGQTA